MTATVNFKCTGVVSDWQIREYNGLVSQSFKIHVEDSLKRKGYWSCDWNVDSGTAAGIHDGDTITVTAEIMYPEFTVRDTGEKRKFKKLAIRSATLVANPVSRPQPKPAAPVEDDDPSIPF